MEKLINDYVKMFEDSGTQAVVVRREDYKKDIETLITKTIKLQQKIDKAKKYLKKQSRWNRISCYGIDGEDVFELLDILRGKDNEI